MTEPPLYRLFGVRREETGHVLLEIPELSIGERTITAVVGANGSGKSTLLRVLALLDRPQAGTIDIRGEAVSWSPRQVGSWRRQITLVEQEPYLFSSSVARNVAHGLRIRRVPAVERRHRVVRALARVGLSGSEMRPARSLSGGETRRAALARAMVLKPEVLLLDEPFASVDSDRIEDLERLILELNREAGTTVVLSTHDLDQARRLAGTVLTMAGGRVARGDGFQGDLGSKAAKGSASLGTAGTLVLAGGDRLRCTIVADRHEALGDTRDLVGRVLALELAGDVARLEIDGGGGVHVELALGDVRRCRIRLGDRVAVSSVDEPTGTAEGGR